MDQPAGSYPRLNAQMMGEPQFNNMIVSVVGRVQSKNMADGEVQFQCCDGGVVAMDSSQAELPENTDGMVYEAIGQLTDGQFSLFIFRELSKDTNLEVYNKMLAVQQNPKFASYFTPISGDTSMMGQ